MSTQISLCKTGLLLLGSVCLTACATEPSAPVNEACDQATYEAIAGNVQTGDGQGHGPDIGSDEWQSTVEFRLDVRGNPDVPERGTQAWCDFVNAQLANQ